MVVADDNVLKLISILKIKNVGTILYRMAGNFGGGGGLVFMGSQGCSLCDVMNTCSQSRLISFIITIHITGKVDGLAVYITTAKLKFGKISYSHVYIWRSHHKNNENYHPMKIISHISHPLRDSTSRIEIGSYFLHCSCLLHIVQ